MENPLCRKWVRLQKAYQLDRRFISAAEAVGMTKKQCKLIDLEWEHQTASTNPANNLRLMSFNILAHGLSRLACGFAMWYDQERYTQRQVYDAVEKDEEANKRFTKIRQVEEKDSEYKLNANEIKWENQKEVMFPKEKTDLLFRKRDVDGNKAPISQRFLRVLSVILRQNPDVIALQELDQFDRFAEFLKPYGYIGIFQIKPAGGACSKHHMDEDQMDGVAIFYDKYRLELNGQPKDVEGGRLPSVLRDPNTGNYNIEPNSSKQVYLTAKLRIKETGAEVRVFTLHAKSGSKSKDKPHKAAQAKFLAKKMNEYRKKGEKVIMAGDFNFPQNDDAFRLFNGDEKSLVFTKAIHKAAITINLDGKHPVKSFMDSVYPLSGEFVSTSKRRDGGEQKDKINKKKTEQQIDFGFKSNIGIKTLARTKLPTSEELTQLAEDRNIPDVGIPN